jgi:hypothetical protein
MNRTRRTESEPAVHMSTHHLKSRAKGRNSGWRMLGGKDFHMKNREFFSSNPNKVLDCIFGLDAVCTWEVQYVRLCSGAPGTCCWRKTGGIWTAHMCGQFVLSSHLCVCFLASSCWIEIVAGSDAAQDINLGTVYLATGQRSREKNGALQYMGRIS